MARDGSTPISVVYVSHNGVGTPLVRSQVLPYLRGLELSGVRSQLVTYERSQATFPTGEYERARWTRIRGRKGAGLVAKILDASVGVIVVAREVIRRRATLIHARSYLPAGIALIVGLITRRPYVFDMRGFLGDEYLDTGYWRRTDLRYRALRAAERFLLIRAAEIVVLTEPARERLRTDPRYAWLARATTVTVIPSAVDLERFRPQRVRSARPMIVYAGSLGTFYELDAMLRIFASARELVPELRFRIVNQYEHSLVRETVARHGIDADAIELVSADFAEMPKLLAEAHVGIALIQQAVSKAASSAIKVAEYLACGLAVVVNAGLGDTAEQVRRSGAGHVVESYEPEQLHRAARETARLLDDERARANARALAEAHYDLRSATAAYRSVYGRVARGLDLSGERG